jgi:hypothetical protein
MFYTRTYFDKDNLIIKDSYVNLGANPVAELFYGGDNTNREYSRYIFHFNENRLKTLYENCQLGDLSKTTHKLKFTPTFQFYNLSEKCFASDVRLCLFEIGEDWVEGCGYDYGCDEPCQQYTYPKCNKTNEPSNWFERMQNLTWSEQGIYNNITGTPLSCVDINCNIESIEFDVTDYVNGIITGDTVNYGLGLAFSDFEELNYNGVVKSLGIFSRNTNTYFKPFLETFYENPIIDTRNDFYLNTNRKLCLYTNIKNTPVNLDNNPTIVIKDSDENVVQTSTGVCEYLGVYSVNLNVTGSTDSCGLWTDTWSNLNYQGNSISDVEMEFEIKDSSNYFQFGDEIKEPVRYAFTYRGIKMGEKVTSGEIRKITVLAKEEFNNHNNKKIDDIFIKIYVKQGTQKVLLFDWMQMNSTACENWFILDTSWLQAQEYFVDFKVKSGGGEEKFYNEMIYFSVVNQF